MSSVVAFDTETWLIEPGLLAPPLVCLQYQRRACNRCLFHRDDPCARDAIREWLNTDVLLVGHNVAFDMGVIAAQWPDLIPFIFAKYDRDQVTDTQIREQLIMISRGQFKFIVGPDGEPMKTKYSLADCFIRHFGRAMKKEGFRMFYRAFEEHPDVATWDQVAERFQADIQENRWPQWVHEYFYAGILKDADIAGLLAAAPWEAREYALNDATNTLDLYQSQERFGPDVFRDQFRQARSAFAAHLSSCWGLYTDPDAVDKLEVDLRADFDRLRAELQASGLIREDGTANVAAARDAMCMACQEEAVDVMVTKGGAVSLSSEACGRFADEDGEPLPAISDTAELIVKYSQYLTLRKTLSNDIKMLRAGCENPVQPRYDLADTGRKRASGPNIQAINRGAGIRECFRPRPGTVFIQADYEGLELHTFAAWCLEKIGWSKMAEALNAGEDPHLTLTAEILNTTYEDVAARLKAKDPIVKETRTLCKPINFGVPGGMGPPKLARYARVAYHVIMTPEQARGYRDRWLARFPEANEFFALAAAATNNPDQLGDEEHIFTGRMRGNMRYSALCNGRFQGLGADAATEGFWRVTRACYAEPASPLYGTRPVAFVHDELICETPDGPGMPAAAAELGRLMIEGANKYLGRVPVRLKPQAMTVWSKKAEPTYDANGQLIAWRPEAAA